MRQTFPQKLSSHLTSLSTQECWMTNGSMQWFVRSLNLDGHHTEKIFIISGLHKIVWVMDISLLSLCEKKHHFFVRAITIFLNILGHFEAIFWRTLHKHEIINQSRGHLIVWPMILSYNARFFCFFVLHLSFKPNFHFSLFFSSLKKGTSGQPFSSLTGGHFGGQNVLLLHLANKMSNYTKFSNSRTMEDKLWNWRTLVLFGWDWHHTF